MAEPLHTRSANVMCCVRETFRSIQFFRVVINLVKFYIVVGCCCWCWCCVFLFSIWLCGMAVAAATAVFESFALCFFTTLPNTYARSRASSSSNMVLSRNSHTPLIPTLLRCLFFPVFASAWPDDWTMIFNAIRFFLVCVPFIVGILFRKQLVMHLLNLNLHDTAHPLKNAASYLMFCKQQIASNYLNCKSICGRFIGVWVWLCVCACLCEENGHRVKSMNFKTEFMAVRSFSLLSFCNGEIGLKLQKNSSIILD